MHKFRINIIQYINFLIAEKSPKDYKGQNFLESDEAFLEHLICKIKIVDYSSIFF